MRGCFGSHPESPSFIGYYMTYEEFKKEFRNEYPNAPCRLIKEMHQLMFPEINLTPGSINTIASCNSAVPPAPLSWASPVYKKQEGEKPMCYAAKSKNWDMTAVVSVPAPVSIEATQRDHATSRAARIADKHLEALRKQFFLDADDAPKTAEKLIEAIKNGDFTLDEKMLDEYSEQIGMGYYNNTFGIRWGKNKPDKKGYEAARKALKEKAQDVADTIVLGPADRLKDVLDEFKNWTYSA